MYLEVSMFFKKICKFAIEFTYYKTKKLNDGSVTFHKESLTRPYIMRRQLLHQSNVLAHRRGQRLLYLDGQNPLVIHSQ